MPKCLRIIPRAKLTRIADLTKSTPEWNEHLKLLSAEGCLCIMQGEDDPPDKFYLVLFDYPNRFRSFSGELEETDSEIRLITKDTGYVFTVTDFEMTKEKGEFLRGQLSSLLTLLEAENAISKYLNNDNTNDNR
ncbi:hypothetical protein SAMN02910353_01183 [Ruminococcus sp. YRD2003]|uniref:hypothetical protein n=1 Tax=Ruminococcus sp. YRD2003 TaxID=1452313 RepID=UPI0008B57DFD|nr:hypothetical protein SAMN02910353_01183 [Ruminococcus flavefaciens]